MLKYCINDDLNIDKYIYQYLDKDLWTKEEVKFWFKSNDKINYKPISEKNVDYYPGSIFSKINNRVKIIEDLLIDRLNLDDNCPKQYKPLTFKVLNGVIKNINKNNKNNHLWFLKEDNTAYSQGINVFNNIEDVKKNIDIKKNMFYKKIFQI